MKKETRKLPTATASQFDKLVCFIFFCIGTFSCEKLVNYFHRVKLINSRLSMAETLFYFSFLLIIKFCSLILCKLIGINYSEETAYLHVFSSLSLCCCYCCSLSSFPFMYCVHSHRHHYLFVASNGAKS